MSFFWNLILIWLCFTLKWLPWNTKETDPKMISFAFVILGLNFLCAFILPSIFHKTTKISQRSAYMLCSGFKIKSPLPGLWTWTPLCGRQQTQPDWAVQTLGQEMSSIRWLKKPRKIYGTLDPVKRHTQLGNLLRKIHLTLASARSTASSTCWLRTRDIRIRVIPSSKWQIPSTIIPSTIIPSLAMETYWRWCLIFSLTHKFNISCAPRTQFIALEWIPKNECRM